MASTIERYRKIDRNEEGTSRNSVPENLLDQLYRKQINKLQQEGKILSEKNAELLEKCGMQPLNSSMENQDSTAGESSLDVEIELFVGLPKGWIEHPFLPTNHH